jgi:mono/diheme cytochrome c family protein
MRILIIALLASTGAIASDYIPDPENGAFLHGDHCIDCHRVDNHEALYTRDNRIVQERIRLNGQISVVFMS